MNITPVILVAEDDPLDASLLRWAFSRASVDVKLDFVEDGIEAIEYLQDAISAASRVANPFPSLLIMDLKMPCVDGIEVLEWISRQPELSRLPVVVLSSSNYPQDMDRAHELGADYYMFKPATAQELVHTVRHLCSHWLTASISSNPQLR